MLGIPSLRPFRCTLCPAVVLVAVGVLLPACRATPGPVTAASAYTAGRDCAGRRVLMVDNHTDESVEVSARTETTWGPSVFLGAVVPGQAELELPGPARLFYARGVNSGRLVTVMTPSSRRRPVGPYVELRVACRSAQD
jgi:hypothetical protein